MRFNIEIDDNLAKEFKVKIIKKFGSLRGHVEQAFEEAIRCWLSES